MPLSVNEELRRTFELATLRKEAQIIRHPDQWKSVQELRVRCTEARKWEKDLYARHYHTRVEQRRRQLVDQAGAKHSRLVPWGGSVDRFSPAETLRQAQRDVRLIHAARIQRIDDFEHRHLNLLLERYARENGVREKVMSDFGRAADRRSGVERRRVRSRDG